MKTLTVRDIWNAIVNLPSLDIPVVIVGERQVAVSVEVIYQRTLNGEDEAVGLQIQLIPREA